MDNSTLEEKSLSLNCVVCGKEFTPTVDGDTCCSHTCKAILRTRAFIAENENAEKDKLSVYKRLDKPPKFDLKNHPKSRAEWFMSLPDDLRFKFRRFLSREELEWAREIAKRQMAEEKFYCGFYVKNGRIIEEKKSREQDSEQFQQDQDAEDAN